MQKMILVLGVTGTLGQPISYSLKKAGFRVRIMTRDSLKARKAFDDSFEMVAGDPMDTGCLEKALRAVTASISVFLPRSNSK